MTNQVKAFAVWKDVYQVIAAPAHYETVLLLHAVLCAFAYRASPIYEHGRTAKGVFCCLLMALGGGTLASILMATPPSWLVNNVDLPIYTTGFFLVCRTPLLYPILRTTQPVALAMLDLIDVTLRAMALSAFQAQASKLPTPTVLPSTPNTLGQILIGTISVTGGGIALFWLLHPPSRFTIPVHDTVVCLLANLLYAYNALHKNRVFISQCLWDSVPVRLVRSVDPGNDALILALFNAFMDWIRAWADVLGIPTTFKGRRGEADLRALCALFMLVGFLLRPGRWAFAEKKENGKPEKVEKRDLVEKEEESDE
ncbi:hypothetical protein HDU80_000186 [Chytriomyces hyalinus]|nr:hypothetical protein HDU80_000186 [Chytriomyces hyalinus]